MPAKSEKQRKFFGMIHGAQKRGIQLPGKAGKVEKSMIKKQTGDFAKKRVKK